VSIRAAPGLQYRGSSHVFLEESLRAQTGDPQSLAGERLVLQGLTQREGGSCPLKFALTQGCISGANQKQGGSHKKTGFE